MLKKRLISSIVIVGLIFLAIWNEISSGILITLFIILGLNEFFDMLGKKGVYKYFGIFVRTLIPLSIVWRFEPTKAWELFFIICVIFSLFLIQFLRRKMQGAIMDISTTIFGILYVSWFFSFLIRIRYLSDGLGLLTSVLVITKLNDIGAYFIGTKFGKTPLIPHISPKKTWEGSIGGVIFSILGAIICRPFLKQNILNTVLLGLFLGVLGQLGDLSESLMKRDCQLKDSGNIIPGMGGILDIIDSLIFVAPVFYFYVSLTR
ncbi:MAG: phosphatidate cytidylyltransferase [Candidatus Omnitrophica bacterium]|nr:phosphatidate cytidylyltransferase [Candidatus Omnitrophota bacterium]